MPTCPKCCRFFDRSWDLSRHQGKKIPCDRNRCSNCRVIFATPYTLQTHLDKQVCLKPPKPKPNDVSIKPPSDQHIATINLQLQLELAREATKKAEIELATKKAEIELAAATKKAEIELATATKIAEIELAREATAKTEIELARETAKRAEAELKINTPEHSHIQTVNAVINGGNNNQIIQLVTFGSENLSGLTPNIMNRISADPVSTIPELAVRKLYFNPKIPENQIIQANNSAGGLVNVYNGQIWETVDRDAFADKLVEHTSNAVVKRCSQIPLKQTVAGKLQTEIKRLMTTDKETKLEMGIAVEENIYNFTEELTKVKQVTF